MEPQPDDLKFTDQQFTEDDLEKFARWYAKEDTMTEKWQFLFAPWIGQHKFGVRFVGARKNGRGAWVRGDDLPDYVRNALGIEKQYGTWNHPSYTSPKDMVERMPVERWNKYTRLAKGWIAIGS